MTTDTFLYHGALERERDLAFINLVGEKKEGPEVNLILVTAGGDPDAAFKISRYLQTKYDHVTVTVSGLCKSAGTLLALGAHELVFAPYGELGPLDIQMFRADHVAGLESGLNISEAFQSIEQRARVTYQRIIADIITSSGGIVSFQTASHAAIEAIAALYSPIFSRIDPEEVGSRSRAMRIGQDYGRRLSAVSQNLKDGALEKLAQTYSSHSFVIDVLEARSLFNNVRDASALEIEAIISLGDVARMPSSSYIFEKIEWPDGPEIGTPEDVNAQPTHEPSGEAPDTERDGSHSEGTGTA
jgi:hypothetical protein